MADRKLKNILITGGAGFIGSNFIHYLFDLSHSDTPYFKDAGFTGRVINVDSLTYAGNIETLEDVAAAFPNRYFFEKIDICDRKEIERIFKQYDIDTVIHFAAESHVDRSITGPETFIKTNIFGTFTLLDVAKNYWNCSLDNKRDDVIFHHISTDEVYGSLDKTGVFTETSIYAPHSPYSAAKAGSDHLVMSYYHTFGLPVTISNCSNNFGPFQNKEKFIPFMISNIIKGKELPIYGTGNNVRDWIYVEDHNRAVWEIIRKSTCGEKWNIGGECELTNNQLLGIIIEIIAKKLKINENQIKKTVKYVKDRPGHDLRYAIDCSKIKAELGWERKMSFEQGIFTTVNYYLKEGQK